jgi:uncharacterized protein
MTGFSLPAFTSGFVAALSRCRSAMTRASERHPNLVAAMLAPAFYPDPPATVELRETHTSWVFLAGELAYKVKKPVVFPFLDYGTVERRHEMCREEVRLNRRLAPDIYLQVVGIVRVAGRYSLASENDPEAVEHAVEMRRVEEDRSLAALASGGELEPWHVEAVARRVARFHAEAPSVPPEVAHVDQLAAALEENLATLRAAGARVLDEPLLAAAERFTWSFLEARRGDLEARARSGLVRDGHGDLRAEHAIVPAQDPVYVYDCVEFDPALRRIDVGIDLAFLVMDLARLGAEGLALSAIDAYRDAGGDPGDDAMVSFFASYRAWVRAKVACLRALELADDDAERERHGAEARELLRLGHRFAWRARGPLVLVICGVAGSGKTTLARELAERSGWPRISSDLTRKRLAGLAATERGGSEHYSRELTARTYEEMGRAARVAHDERGGAIVDATFHRREERAAFRRGLGDGGVPMLFVECMAPREVLLARARRRELEPDRVSDAGAEIVERQLAELEPLEDVSAEARTQLVTDASRDELVGAVEELVDGSPLAAGRSQ